MTMDKSRNLSGPHLPISTSLPDTDVMVITMWNVMWCPDSLIIRNRHGVQIRKAPLPETHCFNRNANTLWETKKTN